MPTTISWKYRYDTWPLTSEYSYFNAYELVDIRYNDGYITKTWVDLMEMNWMKKTVKKWSKILSEQYLAWWNWYGSGDMYLVTILTNSSADSITAYAIKSSTELWDDYNTYRYAFNSPEDMTDEIWDTIMWWFSLTLTTSSSQWVITISDGSQSVTVDSTSHNMRYAADYYAETNNAVSEYSTMSTNWRLVDGEHWPYNATEQESIDWSNIIESLKTKWIANATITHDTVNWDFTMTNWPWSITIADKNLWATQIYEDWDTLSEANCGKMYQWWNNYGFPRNWAVTTSSTKVDTTWYGPWNSYSDGTYIIWNVDWASVNNTNLWWDTADTEYARQWPCPSWYHIPSIAEVQNVINMFNVIRPRSNKRDWTAFLTAFSVPKWGRRKYQNADIFENWSTANLYTSTRKGTCIINEYNFSTATWLATAIWCSIRPFKNTYTLVPISNLWTWDETSTAAIMNQHPYDYYLLWWCESVLRLLSDWTMHNVYASYDSNTNTRSVSEVW